ncbi:hypothetical protein ABPG72_017470 [Tetrahymena utriculariae]
MVVGTLIVRPKSAAPTKDTAEIAKMDPFQCNESQKQKSKVAEEGDKHPTWADQFTFKIINDNILTFSLFDSNSLDKDEFIDPFINIVIGNQKETSAVCKDGGKKSVWNDQFTFKIFDESMLNFTVYDYEDSKSNELKAEGFVSLVNVFQSSKQTKHVSCMRKGKPAGQVVFEIEFNPAQQGQPLQQGFPPQMGYPQQVPQGSLPQQNYPPQNPYSQQYPPQQYPGQIPMQQYPSYQYPAQDYPPIGQVQPGAYGNPAYPQYL